MTTSILLVLIVLSAIMEIRGEYRPTRTWIYIFKPLTTALILVLAVSRGITSGFDHSVVLIVLGLAFSMLGDIFLMLPSDRFIPGLLSFLTAHLCYIAAFTVKQGFGFTVWLLLVFALFGAILLRLLWSDLGKMKLPVIGYVLVIMTMGWQAWERYLAVGGLPALSAGIGALFFAGSDSVLAWRRFRKPFPSARLIVMVTYYTAQLLIALSVGG